MATLVFGRPPRGVPLPGKVVLRDACMDGAALLCCGATYADEYDTVVVRGEDPPLRDVVPRVVPNAELWIVHDVVPRKGGLVSSLAWDAHGARAHFASYVFVDRAGVCTRVYSWDRLLHVAAS